MIKMTCLQLSKILSEFLSEPLKILILVGGIVGLLMLYYAFKQLIEMLRAVIQASVGRPSLVRETSYAPWYSRVLPSWSELWPTFLTSKKNKASSTLQSISSYFTDVILNRADFDKIIELAVSTVSASHSNISILNVVPHSSLICDRGTPSPPARPTATCFCSALQVCPLIPSHTHTHTYTLLYPLTLILLITLARDG